MTAIHDELLVYWELDAIRNLKNAVTSLELYASEVELDDPILGRYFGDMAAAVECKLDEFKDTVKANDL